MLNYIVWNRTVWLFNCVNKWLMFSWIVSVKKQYLRHLTECKQTINCLDNYLYSISSSSSSCRAASTDIHDPLSLFLPIVHRFWQVFRATSSTSQSCCMYVRAGRPAFVRPYEGVHRSTSLMSSFLLLQKFNRRSNHTKDLKNGIWYLLA